MALGWVGARESGCSVEDVACGPGHLGGWPDGRGSGVESMQASGRGNSVSKDLEASVCVCWKSDLFG